MKHKYTKELIEPIVISSYSWAEVCRKLDIKPATGSQTHLTNRAKSFGIDYSHFTGKLWSKGKILGAKRPIEDYLTKNSSINSDALRRRLIREGLKLNACENCEINSWLGGKVPLELDHINGDHCDNRLDNLQILCPNCHAVKTNPHKYVNKPIKVLKTSQKNCIDCGKTCTATRCKKCSGINNNPPKINWPGHKELLEMVNASNYSRVSKELGVSDNAVRKKLKRYAGMVKR